MAELASTAVLLYVILFLSLEAEWGGVGATNICRAITMSSTVLCVFSFCFGLF